jgi:hypothetical protein
MNDDPTQLFPQTHWKRYATEPVCGRTPHLGRVVPQVHIATDLRSGIIAVKEPQKLTKLPAIPQLN